MEDTQNNRQAIVDEMYRYAANLFLGGKNSYEVKSALIERGLDEQNASIVTDTLEQQIVDAKKTKAKKDMLYGALWCVGGTALTMANVGFIFWGAIIFGAIQFIKGVSNLN